MTDDMMLMILKDLDLKGIKVMEGAEDTNIQFCCPFHGERNPSCGISVTKTIGKCFACGETFNLPKLVAFCKGISIVEAYELLKGLVSEELLKTPIKYYEDRDLPKERFETPMVDLAPFRSGKIVHPYLLSRGFSPEDFKTFSLGWDSVKKRITIPFFWEDGALCGFCGRAVLDTSDSNYASIYGKQPKYYIYNHFPAHHILYPLHLFKSVDDTVILVEGLLDSLWLHKMGYTNALALGGCSISKPQIELLKSLRVKKIILALDNDAAGKKGIERMYRLCKDSFTFKVVTYPSEYKDVQGMSKEEIETLLLCSEIYPKIELKRME